MQDADEPVGELAPGGVVLDVGGALGVVEGADACGVSEVCMFCELQ